MNTNYRRPGAEYQAVREQRSAGEEERAGARPLTRATRPQTHPTQEPYREAVPRAPLDAPLTHYRRKLAGGLSPEAAACAHRGGGAGGAA